MYATCFRCNDIFETPSHSEIICPKCYGYNPQKPVNRLEVNPRPVVREVVYTKLDFPYFARVLCEDAALRGVNIVIGIEEQGKITRLSVGDEKVCTRLARQLLADETATVEELVS